MRASTSPSRRRTPRHVRRRESGSAQRYEHSRRAGPWRQQTHSAKNIRHFCGQPIIAYSIAAARDSGLFDEIIVSTDDEEIAAIARRHGASTPFLRPSALSDDHTGTTEVVGHAARWALDQGWSLYHVCCTYATAPFVRASDLAAALDQLCGADRDYVFSAGRFSFPVQRAFLRTAAGAVEPMFAEHRLARSQDLPPVFHDAGQFYWGRTDAWIKQRPIFGPRSSFIELPAWRVQDIDTEDDWTMAERLADILAARGG